MTNRIPTNARVRIALLVLPLAAACADGGLTAPPPAPAPRQAALVCEARTAPASVTCRREADGPRADLFGGQGSTVLLASSGVSYDAGTGVFGADVTVRNLAEAPIGTEDGVTASGIRVFFHDGPVATGGAGTVEVANADGTMLGTGSNQPYFAYPGLLRRDQATAARRWLFDVPPTVTQFAFRVYLAADRVDVVPVGQVQQVTAGGRVTCAADPGGALCWGLDDAGQLGPGGIGGMVTVPRRVAGGGDFRAVFAGERHACALAPGSAWCWGDNAAGQLGTGDSLPAAGLVRLDPTRRWTSLAAGRGFTCGTSERQAFCWGSNEFGTLGDGATAPRPDAAPVAATEELDSIVAGGDFACARDGVPFTVCWGRNDWGQLGAPSPDVCAGGVPCARTPQPLPTPTRLYTLALGESFGCGLDAGGYAYCWGRNDAGQLAVGSADAVVAPTAVVGGRYFSRLAAGSRHVCGVAGAVYCWGMRAAFGGGPGIATEPERVGEVTGFIDVAAGAEHTCAIHADGHRLWCWGENSAGQLGTASTTAAPLPVRVLGQAP